MSTQERVDSPEAGVAKQSSESAKPRPAMPSKPAVAAPASPPAAKVEVGPSAAEVARRVRRARARRLGLGLALWVALPSLIGTLYFTFIARNQYESVTTLVVAGDGDRAALVSTLLREHVLSRDAYRVLEKDERAAEHYRAGGDFVSRLADDAGSEARYRYFLDHADIRYESSTRALTLRVRAFSGRHAQRFASALLKEGRTFLASTLQSDTTYLYVTSAPSAPDDAVYPRRAYGSLTILLVSLSLFAIGSLLVDAVREHAQF